MKVYINKTKLAFRIILIKFLAVFSIALLLFGLYLYVESAFASLLIVACSLFLLTAMIHTLKINNKLKSDQQPVLEITDDGVFDRRIMRKPLPWSNMQWKYFMVKGNPSIAFDVLRGKNEYLYDLGYSDKIVNVLSRTFGIPPNTIDLLSLSTSAEEIKAEFLKYKPEKSKKR